MHHSATLIILFSAAVVFGSLDARERLRNGQYPKRDGSLELIQSAEDSSMSDTLLHLSDVLKKLASKLESLETTDSIIVETTPVISTPNPIKEAEELKQALQDLNLSSSKPDEDKNSVEQLSLLSDPKRDQGLVSIDEADDEKTFRRIFARWMVRDMDRKGAW